MTTFNLTQHQPTNEQIVHGVGNAVPEVHELLTFGTLPTAAEVVARAEALAEIAASAMVGGAPYLMAPLVAALKRRGVRPVFAFSARESSEVKRADGSVRKVQTFRHAGWVDG